MMAVSTGQRLRPRCAIPLDILVARTGEVPVAHDQRKLAAILAADVVGYSRLRGAMRAAPW
jgi:class 3 adenylate cyclase